MNKIIFTAIFLCSYLNVSSQNIYSALHHDRKADLREDSKVRQISSSKFFYNPSGIEKEKEISILNSNQQIISQTRIDSDGEVSARLIFFFDSTGTKCLKRSFENWHPYLGRTLEVAFYEYDSLDHLTRVTEMNENNQMIGETLLKNNERGDPIECKVSVNGSFAKGKEIAEYFYKKNLVLTKVIDEFGIVISSDSGQIDYSVKRYKNNVYNDFGDLIKSERYEYEYSYDDQNNWTKKTIYKLINGKRKRNRIFKRKIEYLE